MTARAARGTTRTDTGPGEPAPVGGGEFGDPDRLAELVAAAVLAHPSVAALHGGPFGVIASYLPGRRLTGVRVGRGREPVELGVVLFLDRPIPRVVRELRRQVADLCGGAAVDVTVADVAVPLAPDPAPAGAVGTIPVP